MKGFLVCVLIIVTNLDQRANLQAQKWPTIQPFHRIFSFDSVDAMHLQFSILDRRGREAYRVACASPLASPTEIDNYAYSRDFECHVSLPGATTLPDVQLLAVNGAVTKEWESRGGFWWSELADNCKSDPYWGSTRVYRFRHLEMSIAISDIKMSAVVRKSGHTPYYRLESLKVELSGRPDKGANRPFGGFSPLPEPRPRKETEPYGYQECKTARTFKPISK